jgi:hypothetical protein
MEDDPIGLRPKFAGSAFFCNPSAIRRGMQKSGIFSHVLASDRTRVRTGT